MSEGRFDCRLLSRLGNPKAERLARVMAQDTGQIRDLDDDAQFEGLPDDITLTFRTMAVQYADILGVDPHGEENGEDVSGEESDPLDSVGLGEVPVVGELDLPGWLP